MSETPPHSSSKSGMSSGERNRLIAGAVVVVLILWFAIANRRRVHVDFILFDRQSRMIYVIIVSAVLGVIADRLFLRKRSKKD